jgi:hypothetical protein
MAPRALAVGRPGCQRCLGRQPRVGERGTKRRVLWRMGCGTLAEDCRALGRLGVPTLAAAEGRLGAQTHDAGAALGQPERHCMPSPPKDRFRLQGLPWQYVQVLSA